MAAKGVPVKALDTLPELLEVDEFYLSMYQYCGIQFDSIRHYCELYDLSKTEIIDSIKILTIINNGVSHASS